jgi:carboxyl-terminal processing protease
MKNVRNGFAYKVIKSLATPTKIENPVPTTETNVTFSSASRLPTADNFYVLESVYSLLQDNYLRSSTLDQKDLIYAATEGMVNELGDQYTKFFRPDASADFHNSLDGTVVGIGVVIEVDPQGYLSVTDVIRSGPADKAGILAKDRIIQINGVNVSTKDGIADDIGNLRGKEGTSVDVTVQTGKNIHTLTIVRQKVQIKLVETDTVQNAFRITYSEV